MAKNKARDEAGEKGQTGGWLGSRGRDPSQPVPKFGLLILRRLQWP